MTTMLLLTTVVAAALLLPSVADGICLPFVELETNTTYRYQSLHDLGVDLAPGATSFKFKVRASNDVHVALLQNDGGTSQNVYEVVIGGWSDTRSAIRTRIRLKSRVEARHKPLSASQFRDFWIAWENGVISVGSGVEVGVGRFMTWTDPSPHPVRYIAVSTGWGSSGLWQFAPSSDVSLATNTVYRYQSLHDLGVDLTPGVTSFTFKVRASNDAHVALQQYDGVTSQNIYEVVIGGWRNTQSAIRTERTLPLVCMETANIYQYPSVDDLGVHLNGRTSFTFWVKATNDAHIALLRNKGVYHKKMYEIVIGGWHNTKSVIRERKQGPILAHAVHVPLSGNKHLPFWISFSGGTVSVGAGTEVGTRQFMSWIDLTPKQIRYVGVSTGWGSTGKWLFFK